MFDQYIEEIKQLCSLLDIKKVQAEALLSKTAGNVSRAVDMHFQGFSNSPTREHDTRKNKISCKYEIQSQSLQQDLFKNKKFRMDDSSSTAISDNNSIKGSHVFLKPSVSNKNDRSDDIMESRNALLMIDLSESLGGDVEDVNIAGCKGV